MEISLLQLAPPTWTRTTLGEIVARGGGSIQTGPFGSQLHASDYVPVGVPSIMPVNIGENRLIREGIACIRESDAQRLSKHIVRKGDIIYSRRGDVERRAIVRESEDGWFCGTGCLKVRLGHGVIVPEFAAFYLRHPEVRSWIVRHAVGITMPNLNTSIMESVPFLLPPLDQQQAIAETLQSLDDKIEQNRRTGAKLEGLARGVFKAWFVDFEPVKAKAAGATAFPGMPPETFAALPTRLEDSELGPVPLGWEVRRLQNVLTLHYGKALNKSQREPGHVPVYGSGGVNGTHSKALVRGPGIIVGRKGSVGTLYWEDQGFFPIDTTFYVEPAVELGLHYLFELLNTLGLETMNTDAAVPGLNRDNAYRLEVVVPSTVLSQCFDQYAKSLRDLISHTSAESAKLATLRDYLLPRLLSGRVRVRGEIT